MASAREHHRQPHRPPSQNDVSRPRIASQFFRPIGVIRRPQNLRSSGRRSVMPLGISSSRHTATKSACGERTLRAPRRTRRIGTRQHSAPVSRCIVWDVQDGRRVAEVDVDPAFRCRGPAGRAQQFHRGLAAARGVHHQIDRDRLTGALHADHPPPVGISDDAENPRRRTDGDVCALQQAVPQWR